MLMAVFLPVALISLLVQPVHPSGGKELLVYQAFQAADADLDEIILQAWAQINGRNMTIEELAGIARQTAASMGAEQGLTMDTKTEEYMRIVNMEASPEPGTHLHIGVQNLYPQPGSAGVVETYLMVTWSERGTAANLEARLWNLQSAYKNLAVTPKVTVGLTGTVPGHLTSEAAEKKINQIFGAVAGREKEALREAGLISVSGFSRLIPDSVNTGLTKINLQAALRYHPVDDRTYIYVGSPLLPGEY
ncbi:MAG: YwmB family TATA-box binding protein [Bacillota bacterium]